MIIEYFQIFFKLIAIKQSVNPYIYIYIHNFETFTFHIKLKISKKKNQIFSDIFTSLQFYQFPQLHFYNEIKYSRFVPSISRFNFQN